MTTRPPIATSNMVQVDRGGAWSPISAARARAIIESALTQRRIVLAQGSGHLSEQNLRQPMATIQVWLDRHSQYPSRRALLDFREKHMSDLRLIMPGRASLLEEFDALLFQNPTP